MNASRNEVFGNYFLTNCSGKEDIEIYTTRHIKEAARNGCVLLNGGYAVSNVPSYDPAALLLPDDFLACAASGEKFGCHKFPVGQPQWLEINDKEQFVIKEALFVRAFVNYYELKYVNGGFYDQHGYISEGSIQQRIYSCIEPFATKSLSRITASLLESVKALAFTVMGRPDESKIFVSDSKVVKFDLHTGAFSCQDDDFETTVNRLNVSYDPAAECPVFSSYLCDLLYTEDLAALQEYLGYCLIPSTRGQTALFLKGEGGEGKSILSYLIRELFGRSVASARVSQLETNRFILASLENKLVFLDDDLDSEALKETGTIKTIITATTPMLVERKGQQAHEAQLYSRLFCIGNTHISAAFDRTDGFYRRLLLLTCKPIRKDRGVNKFLKEAIAAEMPGIFNWMLYGLQRLIRNNFEFTRSARALQEIENKRLEENPMLRFVLESGWIVNSEKGEISSRRLLASFREWCRMNAITEPAERTITTELKKALEKHTDAIPSKNIRTEGGKCAGYKCIDLTAEGKKHTFAGYASISNSY